MPPDASASAKSIRMASDAARSKASAAWAACAAIAVAVGAGAAVTAAEWGGPTSGVAVAVAIIVTYLAVGGHRTFYLLWHTFPRDMRAAYRYVCLLLHVYYYQRKNLTVPRVFHQVVKKHPERDCLIFEDQKWTFRDLDEYSNRVAHFLLAEGFKSNDCVAVFMENRPEYVGLWLGCAKIGVVPALINSNLSGQPLLHSINAASAIACIFGTELGSHIEEVAEAIPSVKLYQSGPISNGYKMVRGAVNFDLEVSRANKGSLPEDVQHSTNFNDKLLYIYTSGTTGLPKAAVIKHSRYYFYCAGTYYLSNMGNIRDPIFYNPLPLYHSAGGIVGIGLMTVFGATVVIRKKFSVGNFWKDCCMHNCNGAQYIGEICRYLLSAPETPEEKQHQVQIMFGNGLRPPIWEQFTSRFGIYRIGEFYGATEGNSNVFNIDSIPGAVGFQSVLFPFVYPVRLIRVNETGDVIRDRNGLCVVCQPGEPGEFVGKIVKNHPSRSFDGYVDAEATKKKIVTDVLRKGDSWFRSGDLLVMDEFGWMYFVDRLGDTFRWRGENVSTNEVEAVLSNVLQQQDTIVYGVEVPGVEGRAGMAAIVQPSGGIDLNHFVQAVKIQLPSYAYPIFLRLVEKLDITSTFKFRKLALQKEGYDPNVVSDPLFFYDSVKGMYRALDTCLYNDIVQMKCRL